MIYLLLGKDDFTKKEFFEGLLAENSAGKAEVFDFDGNSGADEILAAVQSGGGLFGRLGIASGAGGAGGAILLRVKNFLSSKNPEEGFFDSLEKAVKNSGCTAVFFEESLDKRKSENKKILSRKGIKVLQFDIPQAAQFKSWVSARAKKYGVKFEPGAQEKFLELMGAGAGDGEKTFGASDLYDLWQADGELRKIKAFSGEEKVSAAEVADLVSENVDDNVFRITNAIGDKNRGLAVKLLIDYLDRIAEGDDKNKIIGLSALIADQLRSIMLMQSLLAQKIGDAQIALGTGFSPGRIFVYKKLARNFDSKKTADALRKLELLDEEIKTSSQPANLLFFMIIRDLA